MTYDIDDDIFPGTGATLGELCTMDVGFRPDVNVPRTSSNPGEIGTVELGCRTVWGFSHVDSAPDDCGAVELDFRRTNFPLGCFPDTTTSSTERSFRFVRGAGVGMSSSSRDVFCTGIDGSRASSVCGAGGWSRQVHPPWSIASASPAPAWLETSGEEDSRCSVDQMSVSSACLNLDEFSSSSEEDSQDSAERSSLSVTLFCFSDEAGTCVNSDQVSSDGVTHTAVLDWIRLCSLRSWVS